MLWAESPSEREWSWMRGFSKHYLSCAAHMTKRTFYNAEWTVPLNMTWNLQGNYTHLGSSSPFVRSNTEPRYKITVYSVREEQPLAMLNVLEQYWRNVPGQKSSTEGFNFMGSSWDVLAVLQAGNGISLSFKLYFWQLSVLLDCVCDLIRWEQRVSLKAYNVFCWCSVNAPLACSEMVWRRLYRLC